MTDRTASPGARRELLLAVLLAALPAARAQSNARDALAALSQRDVTAGLKAALSKGAEVAVQRLGRADGFWGDERVRIPLPEWLEQAESTLRLFGRGRDVDALKLGINRAAEQAVPEAKALLVNAVRAMSVQDAKGILTGGDDSVTRFFEDKTRSPLTERFAPIVSRVTSRIGLARRYNALAARAEQFGLLPAGQARIEHHVTTKALDGLYFVIGEEEKKIRADPIGAGSEIIRRVFGAI